MPHAAAQLRRIGPFGAAFADGGGRRGAAAGAGCAAPELPSRLSGARLRHPFDATGGLGAPPLLETQPDPNRRW